MACESRLQMRYGFHIGRPRSCQSARLQPVADRLLGKSCLTEMARDQLRVSLEDLGKPRLDNVGYTGVQCLPALFQQAFIGLRHVPVHA
jgi:hypothetical protein